MNEAVLRSVQHLGMCLAAHGYLTSNELTDCNDFATEVVMTWRIMVWE